MKKEAKSSGRGMKYDYTSLLLMRVPSVAILVRNALRLPYLVETTYVPESFHGDNIWPHSVPLYSVAFRSKSPWLR